MIDKFQFSDNQTLTNIDSTGEISSNIWDLEEDASVDQQVEGWLNIHIVSAVVSGLTEGLDIQLRTSDSTDGSTPRYLGCILLAAAEVVTGKSYSFGVSKAKLHKYLMAWFKAVSTANTGAIVVEVWFSEHPITSPDVDMQKKPT